MEKKNNHRLLGFAFLLQALTSLISGAVLLGALIIENDITATLTNIANHPNQLRAGVLLDTVTAMGIIFLGVMLFTTLKKQNEKMATIALGLYIFEAAILAITRLVGFSLLPYSQVLITSGPSPYLQTIAESTLAAMNFGYTLHMLPFCFGAFLFYFLLNRSQILPRWVTLWGLITVIPTFIATVAALFGIKVPFVVYLPYAPFEFVVGIWLLVKKYKA